LSRGKNHRFHRFLRKKVRSEKERPGFAFGYAGAGTIFSIKRRSDGDIKKRCKSL